MAFFGVIPSAKEESFGTQLARGLGSGLSSGVAAGSQLAAQMGMEKAKQAQKNRLVQQLLGGSGEGHVGEEGFLVTPEKILAATTVDPALGRNLAELYKTQEKTRMAEKKESGIKETAQTAFDTMASLLKKGNVGLGAELKAKSPIGFEETAQDVGEFNSSLAGLEAMLVDMVSRGTLSNTRFNFIKDTLLPKPGDRQPTIRGKLKGLAKELKLNPSELGIEEERPESSDQLVKMRAPDGSIRNVPKSKVKSAMQAGGKVVR